MRDGTDVLAIIVGDPARSTTGKEKKGGKGVKQKKIPEGFGDPCLPQTSLIERSYECVRALEQIKTWMQVANTP
jgi:hypothetical protein